MLIGMGTPLAITEEQFQLLKGEHYTRNQSIVVERSLADVDFEV